MRHFFAVTSLFILLLTSCTKAPSIENEVKRPYDPFVFRSVLDWKPRMVTLALSDEIWASYDAKHGSLYKIWGGTVHFDGPVYTQAHGPQPISIGNAYFENEYLDPWYLTDGNNDTVSVTLQYKGHKIIKGKAALMYQLQSDKLSKPVAIEEWIEASRTEAGQPIYQRKFVTSDVPQGYKVHLKTNVNSIVVDKNITTDGNLKIVKSEEIKFGANDSKTALKVNAILTLKSNAATMLDITLLSTPLIDNANQAGEQSEDKEDIGLPEGGKLIAKADCKTCHNKNLKTIGPAYVSIAEKYETSDANISMLAGKIKKGGSGVWGNQVMTPHPEVSDTDLKEMVKYILGLDANESKSAATTKKENEKPLISSIGQELKDKTLIPGLATKAYLIPKGVKTMPQNIDKLKVKYAGVLGNLDNVTDIDFVDLSNDFMLVCSGYLYIDKPGKYNLELWSDDGSILMLDGKSVLDNDGLHGTELKSVDIEFTKGHHPITVQFFQGGGGKFLSFNWIKPGDKEAEVIPVYNLLHEASESQSMQGYTLPMAVVTNIPGDRTPLVSMHPAFDLAQARPEDFKEKVGGIDFLSDGTMIVCTWDAKGSVYRITNATSGDPSKMKATRIAAGLAEPLGLKVVDDKIYVMQKQEMTQLVDIDGDHIIDEYRTLTDGWGVSSNFHEFGFGLAHKDGYLYAALATAIQPGGASGEGQIKDRGNAIKVNIATGAIEYLASGLRTPNGVGLGFNNEIFIADNQGDWLPSSKIVHITKGAWFGSRSVDFTGTASLKEKQPVVWLPQDEIGNSPSTPLAINVGPYKGQMIHGEVTHGGIKRVFVEEVNGQLQGAVFRFMQGLEGGVNRLQWGPDGSLYAGCIGNPGNWQQSGKAWYGLHKITYNKNSVFEMLAVRSMANGIEIELTEPLKPDQGWSPTSYLLQQWYYKPTKDYGGPKLDLQTLNVKSATVSADRKKVFLEINGIKKGHVVYLRLAEPFISELDHSLWTTEAWYTMNEISSLKGSVGVAPPKRGNNTLSDNEIKTGWKLLFDGKSLNGFTNFKKKTVGKSWIINDEAIHLNAVKEDGKWQAKDGGDLVTLDEYENFEFSLDWKIANCGNSGIIFNIIDDPKYDYVWQTGPEMQILDNTCHPDTRFETHRAGDLYDMIACKFITVKPAGEWNKVTIKSVKGVVDFYLNGYNVVHFTMHNKEWKDMVGNSKFKDMKGFGTSKKGKIALQDHGDKIWFRNIKIRKL